MEITNRPSLEKKKGQPELETVPNMTFWTKMCWSLMFHNFKTFLESNKGLKTLLFSQIKGPILGKNLITNVF